MMRAMAAMVLAVLIAGCAGSGGDGVRDQQREVVRDLAIDVGVMRLMREAPELAPGVDRVATLAIAVLEGEAPVTVAALRSYVESEIPFDRLAPEEGLLVQALVELVALELLAVVPDGVLDPAAEGRALALLRRVQAVALRMEASR